MVISSYCSSMKFLPHFGQRRVKLAIQEIANFTLRCPKCGKNFIEEQYEEITIDRCTDCDAIYFDADEVELLLGKLGDENRPADAPAEKSAGWWQNLFRRKQ